MQCYGGKLVLPSSVLYYGLNLEERNTERHAWHMSVEIGSFNLPRVLDLIVVQIFQGKVKKKKERF